ncbi:MAG: hypothetical protein ACT4OY_04420 [Alphaproteobacteria bacterium]
MRGALKEFKNDFEKDSVFHACLSFGRASKFVPLPSFITIPVVGEEGLFVDQISEKGISKDEAGAAVFDVIAGTLGYNGEDIQTLRTDVAMRFCANSLYLKIIEAGKIRFEPGGSWY